jgi:hypothetical protein
MEGFVGCKPGVSQWIFEALRREVPQGAGRFAWRSIFLLRGTSIIQPQKLVRKLALSKEIGVKSEL